MNIFTFHVFPRKKISCFQNTLQFCNFQVKTKMDKSSVELPDWKWSKTQIITKWSNNMNNVFRSIKFPVNKNLRGLLYEVWIAKSYFHYNLFRVTFFPFVIKGNNMIIICDNFIRIIIIFYVHELNHLFTISWIQAFFPAISMNLIFL